MCKHAKTRGVWRHAPPEKFCNLKTSETASGGSETKILRSAILPSDLVPPRSIRSKSELFLLEGTRISEPESRLLNASSTF